LVHGALNAQAQEQPSGLSHLIVTSADHTSWEFPSRSFTDP
jgi:hypothetical protein